MKDGRQEDRKERRKGKKNEGKGGTNEEEGKVYMEGVYGRIRKR